jgi:predicted RNA polymerase sigma factor
MPGEPEAWLLTVARRRMIDGARHARAQAGSLPAPLAAANEAQKAASRDPEFSDERLKRCSSAEGMAQDEIVLGIARLPTKRDLCRSQLVRTSITVPRRLRR